MKRKIIIFIAIIVIPFLILLLDHYVLKQHVAVQSSYDQSSQWQYITEHQQDYPASLLKLASQNKEAIPFVKDYPQAHQRHLSMDLTNDLKDGKIPLLLQWDKRWGYKKYGDDMLAINGCGPTCLSMVVSYLKQKPCYNPYYMAKYASQNGYYQSVGTAWSLMSEGAQAFGLQVQQLSLDENTIKDELELGHPIICSMSQGIFTTQGHFIVLREYKNGKIYVNDPNSQEKSLRGYTFDEIQHQIKNLWSYSL